MRKLATLTAAAALLAAGGLLLAPNVAWAGDVTILKCNQVSGDFDVKACESTNVADCTSLSNLYADGASCADALDDLFSNQGYGGRKSNFTPVGDDAAIIYTLVQGD